MLGCGAWESVRRFLLQPQPSVPSRSIRWPPPAAAVKEAPATKFAKDQLKAIIERIERLEEEKKTISDDIRDVYAEAKGSGFDVKALRTIVRLRRQDANERAEQETILETYMQALGMLWRPLAAQATSGAEAWVKAPHLLESSRRNQEMDVPGPERRLAAVLAADMVGYSRLMEVDETGTLARLKTHRIELIDPAIAKNRGRIIKTTGDGMLVEFHSVADAVLCAAEIQRRIGAPQRGRLAGAVDAVPHRHQSGRRDR